MSVLAARPAFSCFSRLTSICAVPLTALLLSGLPLTVAAQNGAAPFPPAANKGGAKAAPTPAPPAITPEIKAAMLQLQAAQKLERSGSSKAAIAAYQEFARLSQAAKMGEAAQMPAYGGMYNLYRKSGDVKGMETALQSMVRIAPQDAGAWVELAMLCQKQSRFDEAKASAERALQLKPPPLLAAPSHFVRAAWAYAHKQWATAETEYDTAARLAPGNPPESFNLKVESLYKLLLVQNEQKQTKPALATAESLLKIAPRVTPARLLAASLKLQEHDPIGALAAYKEILKYEPRNPAALFNSGLLYQQLGRIDEAIPMYAAYVGIAPNEFGGQYNLGLLYMTLHNRLAARKHFAAAAQISPKDVRALFQLALCERDLGFAASTPQERAASLRASEKHFQQAQALDPMDAGIGNQLADLYEHAGRFDDALALFRKRQQDDPDNPENYLRIARLDISKQQLDNAIAEWRKYRSRKPGDPVSYGEIADLLEGQTRWKEASEERLQQIQRDPKNGLPKLELARDYRQLKQPENAETEYKLLLDMDAAGRDAGEKERVYVVAARRNWRLNAWRGLAEIAQEKGKADEAALYLQNVQGEELKQAREAQKTPEAQIYLDLVGLYERDKQIDAARKELKDLTAQRPDDPNAFEALGDFEARQGRIEEAVFAYHRAEERAKNPVEYGLKAAALYQKQNMLSKAIAEYTRLMEKYPHDARLAAPLAEALELSHDDNRALAVYDTLLKANPVNTDLMTKKAVVLTRLKRYPEARLLREAIVDRSPQDYQAYANLRYLYTLENKPDAYRQWLSVRVNRDPANLPAMAALIDAYVQDKQEDTGWNNLRGIMQAHAEDMDVQETYISVLSQHNRLPEAIELRRKMVRRNPASFETVTSLNELLLSSGQPDEADKALAAFADRPGLPVQSRLQARRVLARQYAGQQKADEAAAQYRQILKEDTNDLSSTLALGTLLTGVGRDAEALSLYNAQAGQEKSSPLLRAHFLTLIGDLYVKQGHSPEAEAQYKAALRLNPQSAEANRAMERLKNTPKNLPDSAPTGKTTAGK